jgi:fructose-bisphosphate aldolase class II
VKVNVGTRLNIALTGVVRDRLASDAGLVDARKYLGPGREAMGRAVTDALAAIGRAGDRRPS